MKKDINQYIARFPSKIQKILNSVRKTIHDTAPDAVETMSYGIPTFDLNGRHRVHFAGYKNHIGFYPTPSGIEKFKKEIMKYKWAKGSVQFPINQPIPYDLIAKIVLFRVDGNNNK